MKERIKATMPLKHRSYKERNNNEDNIGIMTSRKV